MKLIIEIPDYRYRTIKKIDVTKKPYTINERSAITAIKNGTPLPKGHGRLIDADEIRVIELEDSLHIIRHEKGDDVDVYIDATTIIEADKGESEG